MEQINFVVENLNIAKKERLKADGFTNSCFFNDGGNLTKEYQWHIKDKKKYIHLNCGSSGVFLIERETGEIFNIKSYGVADKNKKIKANLGKIQDYTDLDKIRFLHSKQYNYLR